MDPIFNAIEKVEAGIGHSPHPAIVALPLGAWTVAALCDALGLATGRKSFDDTARISMGIGLLGAAGAILTGLHDYSYIPRTRPTHAIATSHALLNVTATTLIASSFLAREKKVFAGDCRPSLAARALAFTGCGISLYSGWLGGNLVEGHGEAVKPVIRWQAEEEEREKARIEACEETQPRPSQMQTPMPGAITQGTKTDHHQPAPT